MSGWIKLHRRLIDWEWYTDHNTSRLFIHCILRANFEDNEWRGISIKRGSFYTSLNTLSSETGLSLRQIRTSLDKLVLTGELTSSGMARGRMITVLCYDSFQDDDRVDVSEMTGKRQGSDRVATTNKNDKKNKNIHSDDKSPACPYHQIIDLYHEHLPRLPRVNKDLFKGSAREKNLKARWLQSPKHQSLEFWRDYFIYANKIEWLFGFADGTWTANFEYLTKKNKFEKVLEEILNLNGKRT